MESGSLELDSPVREENVIPFSPIKVTKRLEIIHLFSLYVSKRTLKSHSNEKGVVGISNLFLWHF